MLDRVSVAYGPSTIVREVSFAVQPRETICLVGASGSGKTTVLNAIAGLVPCSAGAIRVDGDPIAGPGADRVMVFQDDAVFPWMTVRKNVEYGLRVKGLDPTERKRAADEALRLVRLTEDQTLYPRQLSGGMRKRVDLARALAVEPDVLLMDEPYAALDAMTREQLQLEYLRIRAGTQTTCVFVTHDLEEALFLGDRVAVLGSHPGRVQKMITVPFGYPRSVELKRTPEFQASRGDLVDALADASTARAPEGGEAS